MKVTSSAVSFFLLLSVCGSSTGTTTLADTTTANATTTMTSNSLSCNASASAWAIDHSGTCDAAAINTLPSLHAAAFSKQVPNEDTQKNHDQPTCSLYFAPSTIRGGGWGLYTATDLEEGDQVGHGMQDIILPIFDTFKTMPYRGQQRFLPWLAYVWPEKLEAFFHSETNAFPIIEPGQFRVDDGLSTATSAEFYFPHDDTRMNAFAPGIASQANSNEEWDNIFFRPQEDSEDGHFQIYEDFEEGDDEHEYWKGPRSRFHHGGFATNQFVPAGSELFFYYGETYHEQLRERLSSNKEYETLEDYKKKLDFSTISTEEEKRGLLNTTSMRLRTDPDASFQVREPLLGAQKRFVPRRIRSFEEPEGRPGRSVDWLAENGVCVDNLSVDESTISEAGYGAFARHRIAAGQVVSHAPLLHLKRDDLVIYGINQEKAAKTEEGTSFLLNFDETKGQELLLNYCFGHPDSEVLLVPYSPLVNYINHAENPNTMIRWTEDSKKYFDLHPIDVLEQHGGALRMEYVAIRDIGPNEEITIDYGAAWADAWAKYNTDLKNGKEVEFRHDIGVPDGFYPEKWLHQSVKYELAPKGDLRPGELKQVVWKHNGKPLTKFAYHLGLPKGFSQQMLDFTKDMGFLPMIDDLLHSDVLQSDEFFVFNATKNSTGDSTGQWFAQRYKTGTWGFNMHYLAAWDEVARRTLLGQIGRAGFDDVMNGVGTHFGLDSLTCFHASYMAVSKCDVSFTHTDIYATGEVAFNIIWPIMLVNGSKPELNLQADDANTVVSISYEYDTAVLMGDWGYHYTSAIEGYTGDQKRVVVGMYCGQMDENNNKMLAHLYDGEDPAPFLGQFEEPFEYHWSKGNKKEHRMSRL